MPSTSGSYPPLVVYRPGFWSRFFLSSAVCSVLFCQPTLSFPAYASNIPYASSEVSITTYNGGIILQVAFGDYSCIDYLSDDAVELYFIDNSYVNNLAVVSQGCFAQENAENDEIYNQISDYTVDTTSSVLTITVSVDLNSVSGNQVVVAINSSECGYITFAPVSVPYGYTSSFSLAIGNWKVMVPTILAVFLAIVAIVLTIKVASLKSRLERGESSEHNSNEVSYEPILDGRGTLPPLASSATAPLPQNYAPNYNYISYNPNPTNRGQQAPPLPPPPHSASPAGSTLPPPPHHAGLAGPQVVYSSTAPGTTAFPNSSLALYGIPPPSR
jgi:hypothetical protein